MRAVFLDRDGVINENRENYVLSPEQFRFLPRVLDALATLATSPFAVVVVTNQSAVGRGHMTADVLDRIHTQMLERVRAAGGRIDAVYACLHRPDQGCPCRKPRAELLQRASTELELDLERSYFIGDAASDVQAALAVGCHSILALTGRGLQARAELARQHARGYWVASDLLDAVRLIRAREEGHQLGGVWTDWGSSGREPTHDGGTVPVLRLGAAGRRVGLAAVPRHRLPTDSSEARN